MQTTDWHVAVGVVVAGVLLALSLVFSSDRLNMIDEVRKIKIDTRDTLTKMWDQQEEFMRLLQQKRNWSQFPVDLSSKAGQKLLHDIRHNVVDELHEAGQHLKNAKSHRATEIPEVDRGAYVEECIDALHLLFELYIASGITKEEMIAAYLAKGEVNTRRILSGY